MSEWRSRAACKDMPGMMFPPRGSSRRAAAADALMVCVRCPVRPDCAGDALQSDARSGIWGGVDLGDTGGTAISDDKHDLLERIARKAP